MACDICGKVGVSLVPLNTDYQTDAIKDICGECKSEVDKQLWKIRTLNHGFPMSQGERSEGEEPAIGAERSI